MSVIIRPDYHDNFVLNGIVRNNHYEFQIAKPSHKDGIIDIFTDSFCNSEPMTQHLNINPVNFKEFTAEVTENAIKDRLSIVATCNKKVIACTLIEDLAAMHDVPVDFDPNFKYIIGVLEKLGEDFFTNKEFTKCCIAHLFITAVSKDFRGKGLSTQVNFRAMNLASENGFKFVYSELTNHLNTQGIINHLANKKRLIGSCVYNEFEMDGIKPFANLDGKADGYLWEIQKNAKLMYVANDRVFVESL